MNLEWTKIVALAMPVAAVIVNQIIERRPRVVSYVGHMAFFPLRDHEKNLDMIVTTHSIILKNIGRKSANNVRVGHLILPDTFLVVPNTKYKLEPLANNGTEIVFPTLVPKEEVTISYLYSNPLTFDDVKPNYVKSDEGYARSLHAIPTPQPPKWVTRLAQLLILAGIAISVYFILKIAQAIYGIAVA